MRGHRTGNDFIIGGQDDAVARNAQRALENNLIAFGVITLVVFVRLDDFEAIFAARRYRMRQKHFDVVRGGAEILHGRINFRLRPADHFKLQRLPGRQIEHRFI